jgi:SAM-dependent methyltransferase
MTADSNGARATHARAWTAPGRGRLFDRQQGRLSHFVSVATLVESAHVHEVFGQGPVLDVGAGTGRTILTLAKQLPGRLVALDASRSMLEALRRNGRPDNVDLVQGLAGEGHLPFADASFGLAYSFGVMTVLPDWQEALGSLVRVLRPGAPVVFNQHNGAVLRGQGIDLSGRRGIFELDTLARDLDRLGLSLEGVYPVAFFHNQMRRWWGLDRANWLDTLIEDRFLVWVERNLAEPGAVSAWARVESRLGRIMPAGSSSRAVIVCRSKGGPGPGPPHLVPLDDPPAVSTGLDDFLGDLDGEAVLNHPAVRRLLVLLEPFILRHTGGYNPLAAALPDYDDLRARVVSEITALGHPGPGARAKFLLGRVADQGRRVRDAVRVRCR